MSDGNGGPGDWVQDGDDYIYRGENTPAPPPVPGSPTPPPAPGQPPVPPPAGPPPGAPYVTPPPYAPPPAPGAPMPGAAVPPPAAPGGPKKKRWPWIVAGVLLLCGLPLGGCVALVGFGVNEIGNVNDELRASTDTFIAEWNAGTPENALEARCFEGGDFPPIDWIAEGATELEWDENAIAFVKRDGNSYFSSNADPDTSFINGFEDESNAFVEATIRDVNGAGSADVELLFLDLDGDDTWELCGISQN